MYETRRQPLLAPSAFVRRLLSHLAAAIVLLGGSLAAALVLGPAVHRVLHRFHPDRE